MKSARRPREEPCGTLNRKGYLLDGEKLTVLRQEFEISRKTGADISGQSNPRLATPAISPTQAPAMNK